MVSHNNYKVFLLATLVVCGAAVSRGLERPRYRTVYACESSTLQLDCEPGSYIHLIRANYGRFSIAICNEHGHTDWSVNCMSPRSLRVLHGRCSQEQNCSIYASTNIFGDPCPGTLKYLEAHYQCIPATTTTTTMRPRPPWLLSTDTSLWSTAKPVTLRPRTSNDNAVSNVETAPSGVGSGNPPLSTTSSSSTSPTTTTTTTTTKAPIKVAPPRPDFANRDRASVSGSEGRQPTNNIQPPNVVTTTISTTTTTNTAPTVVKSNPTFSTRPPSAISTSSPHQQWGDQELHSAHLHPHHCSPIQSRNLYWNWTRRGEMSVQPCPGGATGFARWRCNDRDPVSWSRMTADLSECKSVWLMSLESRIAEGDSVISIANDLLQVTSSKTLYGGDMLATANIIRRLAEKMNSDVQSFPDPLQREAIVTELLQSVVQTGSHLLDNPNHAPWRDLNHAEQMRVATALLVALEDNAFLLAESVSREKTVLQGVKNILVSVKVIETRNIQGVTFPSPTVSDMWENIENSISLPAEALIENSDNGLVRIVFFAYNNMEEILLPSEDASNQLYLAENKDFMHRSGVVFNNGTRILNSKVISASLGKGRHIQLPEPVHITFKHIRTDNVSNPSCVFWDYTMSSWSEEGCRVTSTNHSHTSCECDHLTNFAILMDVHAVRLTYTHEVALTVITYVGCVISIVCLILAICTFQFFRGLKSDRTTIHKNLCLCLLIAEVLFVAGVGQTEKPILCGIVAGLLHFFFLCAFAWMFLEGFQLYVMLIEVFETEKSRVKWYYAVAYGVPIIIVAVSAVVDPLSYGTERYCWLRADNFFIFSFVGPVIAVILANLVFLSMAIYTMCRHANTSITMKNKEQSRLTTASGKKENALPSKINTHLSWLRGAIILVFLLGLTWTFGLLYLNEESVVMAYVFTVLNSLQGVFIFLFHCVQNEKVRKEYRKFAQRNPWLPSCCCSTSSKSNSSTSKERRSSSLYTNSNGTASTPSAPNSHSTACSSSITPANSSQLHRMWGSVRSNRSSTKGGMMGGPPTLPRTGQHTVNNYVHRAIIGGIPSTLIDQEAESYSRDSGNGGSEQEDSPRTLAMGGGGVLTTPSRAQNPNKECLRMPYHHVPPPAYRHPELSMAECINSEQFAEYCREMDENMMMPPEHFERTLPLRQETSSPQPHRLTSGRKMNRQGNRLRASSPWNHTYMEIEMRGSNAGDDGSSGPVYEEIERNEMQVSDLSDEDIKRQSDVSRQSSRSYSDNRPLIPYAPTDRHHNDLVHSLNTAFHSPKLKQNRIVVPTKDSLLLTRDENLYSHNELHHGPPMPWELNDGQLLESARYVPPPLENYPSYGPSENSVTVAVLNGDRVVCHLQPPTDLNSKRKGGFSEC